MSSTLIRLLTYSKATAAEARENFTTEALAACIAIDPKPMESALRRRGIIPHNLAVPALTPLTQVFVRDAGFLDLVLRTDLPEVWLEVKVDAPESGFQLRKYMHAIDRFGVDQRPRLAVLGPNPLGGDLMIPHVPWQTLWHAITTASQVNPHWRDFGMFLKEIGMADEYNEPIRTREAAALDDARRLLRKLARIFLPVTQELKEIWPPASFPVTEGEVRQALANQFNRNGRYTLSNQNQTRADLVFGVGWLDEDSWLTVRIEHSAKHGQDRLRLIDQADAGSLPANWGRFLTDSKAVRVDRRLPSFDLPADMTAWLLERIRELRSAGMLQAIDQMGSPTPQELKAEEELAGP